MCINIRFSTDPRRSAIITIITTRSAEFCEYLFRDGVVVKEILPMAIRPHYVSFMIPSLLAGEKKAMLVIKRTFDFSIIRFFQVFSECYNSVKQWKKQRKQEGAIQQKHSWKKLY